MAKRKGTSWRFWNRKRLQFRNQRPGEWNVISEPTASALACAGPFSACGQVITVPGDLGCTDTVKGVPIILSSATEGDLAGQPLWPNHTVTAVKGTVFLWHRADVDSNNIIRPTGDVYVALGVRKARFDYDAVTPTFEEDFDPLHEDDMEERWIWRDVLHLGPSLPYPQPQNLGSITVDGYGGGGAAIYADLIPRPGEFHHGVRVNITNRCVLKENEGLIMQVSIAPTPARLEPDFFGYPGAGAFGPATTWGSKVVVNPFLRTFVKMHR